MIDFPKNREAAKDTPFEALFDTPAHWPAEVHKLPIGLFENLGRHVRTNSLYWDGQALVTEKRFSTFERKLAIAALSIATLGSISAVAVAIVEVGRACCQWR